LSQKCSSLQELLSVVVEPTVVIGFDVGPSRFKLSSKVPDELALNVVIKGLRDAVSEYLHIRLTEIV